MQGKFLLQVANNSYFSWTEIMTFTWILWLQEQGKLLWSIHDKLKQEVSMNALRGLLEYNKQDVPSGESQVCMPILVFFMIFLQNISV